MNLSKDAIQLLKWLCRRDRWDYIDTLETHCKCYEYRTFAALKDAGFIDCTVFEYDYEYPEYDEDGHEYFRESYRISDAGKAYLESIPIKRLPEIRGWISICISVIALIVSIIALLR